MEVTYMKMEERDRLPREDGLAEGISQGEERISQLNLLLIKEKRFEDLERAAQDKEYRDGLLKEFDL